MDYVFEKFLKFPLHFLIATLMIGVICAIYIWSLWSFAIILITILVFIFELAIFLGYILSVSQQEEWGNQNT